MTNGKSLLPNPQWKRNLRYALILLALSGVLGWIGAGIWAWVPVGLALATLISLAFAVPAHSKEPDNPVLSIASWAIVALYLVGFAGVASGGWYLIATAVAWFLALALFIQGLRASVDPTLLKEHRRD